MEDAARRLQRMDYSFETRCRAVSALLSVLPDGQLGGLGGAAVLPQMATAWA